MLLQHTSRWKLLLTYIFAVGCCSCADGGKSKENLMGSVLLANQACHDYTIMIHALTTDTII